MSALRIDGHPGLVTTNFERFGSGRAEHDIAKPSGEDKNPSYMRFAWVNLGLGVAWPKTLAWSGHASVIGAPRVKFGSSPVDAEADKTEERPQFISFCGGGDTPFIQLCSALTPQPLAQLGIVRDSALILRRAAPESPAARTEFPPSRGRTSAGWGLLCAESQSIDPADRGNARRTTLQSHGCPANHSTLR